MITLILIKTLINEISTPNSSSEVTGGDSMTQTMLLSKPGPRENTITPNHSVNTCITISIIKL